MTEAPKRIWAFPYTMNNAKDGGYWSAYERKDCRSVAYVRADIAAAPEMLETLVASAPEVLEMLEALKAAVLIYGEKLSPNRLREINAIIAIAKETEK